MLPAIASSSQFLESKVSVSISYRCKRCVSWIWFGEGWLFNLTKWRQIDSWRFWKHILSENIKNGRDTHWVWLWGCVYDKSPVLVPYEIFYNEKQIQPYKSKYQTLDIGLVTVKEMCLLLRSNEVLKVGLGKHHQ